MREIQLTDYDLEKLASRGLGVPTEIDLGPSPGGGRYYLDLSTGLAAVFDEDELRETVEDAVRHFFRKRRPAIREQIATRIREQRRQEREAEFRSCSSPITPLQSTSPGPPGVMTGLAPAPN
jgi:hypothetical protein